MQKATKTILFIIFVLLIVGITGGYYVLVEKTKKSSFDFITAKRETVIQEVNVTGKVKPTESINLSFETSGKVSQVRVDVGDKIESGQIIVSLDNIELGTQLKQAEAGLEANKAQLQQFKAALEREVAKLDELIGGARPEEIKVAETRAVNAQRALLDAQANLENIKNKANTDLANIYDDMEDILSDAYAKADDAVNKQTDDLFYNDSSDNPRLTFSVSDSQAKIDAEWQRRIVRDNLKDFKTEIAVLESDYSTQDHQLIKSESHLIIIRDFLLVLNDALNAVVDLSQSTTNTYKGYVNAARTNINTALSNISAQKQAIVSQRATNQQNISSAEAKTNDAQNALSLAEDELSLKKAGAASEQIRAQEAQIKQAKLNIASQEAQVKQAQAKVENVKAQLDKTIIRSPISGIITKQAAKVGEIILAGTVVVSLISEGGFEIEAYVPEVDIAKVKIEDASKITLDAISDDIVFEAKVKAIDPAETIIDGVATYRTTLQFLGQDIRIKPGMTANVDILTAQRENVIVIPYRTIITKNGEKIVRVLRFSRGAEVIEEVSVQTGLRDSEGNIEIIEGIKEGDKVIIFLEER